LSPAAGSNLSVNVSSSSSSASRTEFPVDRCALLEVVVSQYLVRTYGRWIDPLLVDWLGAEGVFKGVLPNPGLSKPMPKKLSSF
jgi:hypothetical protein